MDFSHIRPYPAESVSVADTYYLLGNEDCLVLRRLTPSRLDADTVKLAQDRMPSGETVLFFESGFFGDLAIMISEDEDLNTIPEGTKVTVSGSEYECAVNHGYLLIGGPFESGCRIILSGPVPEEANPTIIENLTIIEIVPDKMSAPEPEKETKTEDPSVIEIVADESLPVREKSSGFEEAAIYYNDAKKRYLLRIHSSNGAHAILPDGTEISIAAGKYAFTGYRMRSAAGEYDLVVMKEDALKEDAKHCHAYMDVVGSFPGDVCYKLDTVHETGGNHCKTPGSNMIDRDTGYKWGCPAPGEYEFELENGLYTVETTKAYSDGMTASEREPQKVSGGYLRLYGNNYVSIVITACDTISEMSRYSSVEPGSTARSAAEVYIPDPHPVPILGTSSVSKPAEFKTPEFEHIEGDSVSIASSRQDTGLQKDQNADNYDFTPLSGDHIVRYTPDEDTDEPADQPSDSKKAAIHPSVRENETDRTAFNVHESNEKSESELIKNITVSVYSPPEKGIPEQSESRQHIINKLKKQKADSAALTAGIAAGTVAVIGGLVGLLSGRKRK